MSHNWAFLKDYSIDLIFNEEVTIPDENFTDKPNIICILDIISLTNYFGKILQNTTLRKFGLKTRSIDNLLLSGCTLKGTAFVIGCAVYTGLQSVEEFLSTENQTVEANEGRQNP